MIVATRRAWAQLGGFSPECQAGRAARRSGVPSALVDAKADVLVIHPDGSQRKMKTHESVALVRFWRTDGAWKDFFDASAFFLQDSARSDDGRV